MRLYPSILVVSLALLDSGSQASKVRSTAAVDPTTQAASVADNQHGLSLLSTTNGEDRMFRLPNAAKTPDDIVKKDLEKLIPSLGESSSSSRPTINVQGATSSTVRQKLHTLSDEQKIQLGVKFIHDNSLKKLEKNVGKSMRKGGMADMDAFFSALCTNLGDDVVAKVVMDVEKAGLNSPASREELAKAQFRYWQEKRKSYADVSGSLRKLEKRVANDKEKLENFGVYFKMLDDFIKFTNNGKPDDKSLFDTLTQGDGIIEFADFISKSKSPQFRPIMDVRQLEKRYFESLDPRNTPAKKLFDLLKMKKDGIRMFIGPKFDLLTGYVAHLTPKNQQTLGTAQPNFLGQAIIQVYLNSLGEVNLGYLLARAALNRESSKLQNNAKVMANLLFKVIDSDERFESMIQNIMPMEGGKDAANFLSAYRLAYKRDTSKNLEGLDYPFGTK